MIMNNHLPVRPLMLLAGFLASSIVFFWTAASWAQAQEGRGEAQSAVNTPASLSTHAFAPHAAISRSVSSSRAAMMYRRLWGIDNITLRATASGAVIRFSYLVVDANKAVVLNDEKQNPYLVVLKNSAVLEVPATEKVGKLRQTATPENGREYWMVFQNSGHTVRPGDLVNIVIGPFHANGLVVESSQAEIVR
jgi:hypothetical protein